MKAKLSRVAGPVALAAVLCVLVVVAAVIERPQRLAPQHPEEAARQNALPSATETSPVVTRPDRPGRAERVFEAAAFGRYAVRAVSPYGTALHLVDAMSGPGPGDGQPGKTDGRVDAFLDPGSHKAVLIHPAKVDSPPELKVDAFVERNETPLALRDLEPVSTEMQDLEQRSYWIDVRTRRHVFIEAAGRRLADLRLWKDGTWLVDAQPVGEQVMARPGQPLHLMRLVAELEPGLYRLTAYGGPGLTWTEGSPDNPLHLRSGIPTLGEGMRRGAVASPFGVDRWLVPKGANAFRLELPQPGDAAIEAAPNFTGAGILNGERATIDKKSRAPAADVGAFGSVGDTLVSVERQAGEPYVLQSFNTLRVRTFQGARWRAITVTSAGADVDLTTILTKADANGAKVVSSSAVRLAPASAWMRRFNLMGTVTLFVEVTEPGRYAVRAADVDAEVSVDPAFPDRHYKPKGSRVGGGEWDLDAGFHVVTLWPRAEGRGIVALSLAGEHGTVPTEPSPPVTAIDFHKLWMDEGATYRLMINQTGAVAGAQMRDVDPVRLSDGDLVAVLQPGESREVTLRVDAPGTIDAVGEDGGSLPVALDGGGAATRPSVSAGPHTAVVSNPGSTPLRVNLGFAATPDPAAPQPPADLSRLPDFPMLKPGQPRFLDLGHQKSTTFALKVDTPALYRVESTGLLQMSGNLRTQTAPSLIRGDANGTGRNFLLQHYLRSGLYQLTVATRGQSAGHLGLSMTATPLRPGGSLAAGIPARATLGAGEGIAYDVEVGETGTYRFDVRTLASAPDLRLEDLEGWPLTNPGTRGPLVRELDPGRYRLVVMPQPLPSRAVTLAERMAEPVVRQGHGPHVMPLGEAVRHRWEEPAGEGERIPDSWVFDLPADADLGFTLGDGMEGRLERANGAPIADFNHLRSFAGRLEAGSYRLAVRSIQPNNRLDYTIATTLGQLIAGTERRVRAPAEIPVSVGASGLVDITSWGGQDVRATLRDGEGNVVAMADDRADDWNFAIATRLPAGRYKLVVEPVGAAAASTLIRMRAPREVEDAVLEPGGDRILADDAMHLLPLPAAGADDLLVAAARSADEVGLALEAKDGAGPWVVVGNASGRSPRLALARTAGPKQLRLRVWSLDHTPTPITLAVRSAQPPVQSESRLSNGVRLEPVPGLDPAAGVAAIRLDGPGLLRLEGAPAGLAVSASTDRRVLRAAEPIVTTRDGRLWLMGEAGATVKARRVLPPAEGDLAITLPEGEDCAIPVEGGRGPQLWLAESRVALPGIAPEGGDPRTSGWGDGQSVAVVPGGKDAVMHAWRADGVGALPLTLRRVAFATPAKAEAHVGLNDGTLPAGGAHVFALPTGSKRLRLALPPSTAAVFSAKGQVEATLWAGGTSHSETLNSDADELLLLNAGTEGRFSIELSANADAPLPAARDTLTSRWLPTDGRLRLAASADEPLTLQFSGAVETARAVHGNGQVVTGTRLRLSGDAMVEVRHRAGMVALWADGEDADAWPGAAATKPAPKLPATVALADGASWALDAAEPALLRLETSNPVAVGHRRPNAAPEVRAWAQGAAAHLFLPRGANVVGLRALQDGPLSGTARLSAIPAAPIGEGLGPKVRLAPGDARLFTFALTRSGPIGLGVRGGADTARVRLLDESGKVLSTGAVTMTDLDAGRYFLVVENRADAAAVEVQPALVGSTPPDTGPPEDVKRSYWQLVTEQEEVR